jgi:hypothetical protein
MFSITSPGRETVDEASDPGAEVELKWFVGIGTAEARETREMCQSLAFDRRFRLADHVPRVFNVWTFAWD